MNSYWPGTQVKISAIFQVAGVDTDPTATTLYYLTSTGGLVTISTSGAPTLTRDAAGQFHYDVVPTSAQLGTWYYRYVGTGAAAVSAEGAFMVKDTRFTT